MEYLLLTVRGKGGIYSSMYPQILVDSVLFGSPLPTGFHDENFINF